MIGKSWKYKGNSLAEINISAQKKKDVIMTDTTW